MSTEVHCDDCGVPVDGPGHWQGAAFVCEDCDRKREEGKKLREKKGSLP